MSGQVLLASNSTNPGDEYLGHLGPAIIDLFAGCSRIAFVPYALADIDGYSETAEGRFRSLGLTLRSVHRDRDPVPAVSQSDGIFVGGGNTFRLLDHVLRRRLAEPIVRLVGGGRPYLGTSAGSNLACPTIRTTNDMAIVEPSTLDALNLVPFQINAHFVDRDPDVPHGGETRRQRLAEFHEENATAVVGLREGSWLLVVDSSVTLGGPNRATLFRRGMEPVDLPPGDVPGEFLRPQASPS